MPRSRRGKRPVLSAVLGLSCMGVTFGAAEDYTRADIAYGSRLYAAQCATCHGASGDSVGGVDLRSGKFRNATTDQDLTSVIMNGVTGTGMQAFRFDAAELAGIIAYLRSMNTVRAAPVETR